MTTGRSVPWNSTMGASRMVDKRTTIQLSKTTRDRLASLGSKDDSFEDIIKRLIKEHGRD